MTNRYKIAATVFAVAALSFAGSNQAHAQSTTANIDLNLQIESFLNIEVDQPSVTVTPTLQDIIGNTVTKSALFNLQNIQSTGNYDVEVSGDNLGITNTDILLDAGGGDVQVPASGSATLLSNEAGPVDGETRAVNVTINNLQNYSVGTHTTTLTFDITSSDTAGL